MSRSSTSSSIPKFAKISNLHFSFLCAVSVRLCGAACGRRPPPRLDDRANNSSSNGCRPSTAARRSWLWARRPKRPPTHGCAQRRGVTSAPSAPLKTLRTPRACAARPAASSSRRPPGCRGSWPRNPSEVGRRPTASKPLSEPAGKGKTETSKNAWYKKTEQGVSNKNKKILSLDGRCY